MYCEKIIHGLSFHNTQTALPKVFEIRIGNTSSIQIGFMIAIIYFISGATTFVGGLLADRFNLKTIYLMGIFLQFPCYLGSKETEEIYPLSK